MSDGDGKLTAGGGDATGDEPAVDKFVERRVEDRRTGSRTRQTVRIEPETMRLLREVCRVNYVSLAGVQEALAWTFVCEETMDKVKIIEKAKQVDYERRARGRGRERGGSS